MRVPASQRLIFAFSLYIVGAVSGGAWAQGTTQVESFTAGGVVDCVMPGTPFGGGLRFTSSTTLQSLDFAPGSVLFAGLVIDFDGREAAFLANTYNSTLQEPLAVGPGTVTVSGTGTVGGGGGGGGCYSVGPNTPLGPTFNGSHLDIATGPGINLTSTFPSWDSAAIPQLNGRTVQVDGPINVTSVDAVNGLVNFTMNGKIYAGSTVVPALTWLGTICLGIGLTGFAVRRMANRLPRGAR